MDKNKLILKINSLNEIINADNNFFNIGSIARLKTGSKDYLEANFDFNDGNKANLIFGILATKVDKT